MTNTNHVQKVDVSNKKEIYWKEKNKRR